MKNSPCLECMTHQVHMNHRLPCTLCRLCHLESEVESMIKLPLTGPQTLQSDSAEQLEALQHKITINNHLLNIYQSLINQPSSCLPHCCQ